MKFLTIGVSVWVLMQITVSIPLMANEMKQVLDEKAKARNAYFDQIHNSKKKLTEKEKDDLKQKLIGPSYQKQSDVSSKAAKDALKKAGFTKKKSAVVSTSSGGEDKSGKIKSAAQDRKKRGTGRETSKNPSIDGTHIPKNLNFEKKK
jgi:hypothetical protein